jgi:hypothetical protein
LQKEMVSVCPCDSFTLGATKIGFPEGFSVWPPLVVHFFHRLAENARAIGGQSTAKGEGNVLRYVLAWFPMLILAVANGALRQATFAKTMPELRAHQLSTLIGALLIGAFVWFVIRRWPPSSSRQALMIGVLWLLLTLAFEFFMGLVLAKRPLANVFGDYNVLAGRVWVFFLIWLTLAPWVFYRLRPAS